MSEEKSKHVAHRVYTVEGIMETMVNPLDMDGNPIDGSRASTRKGDAEWTGGTLASAKKLVLSGWSDRPNIGKLANEIMLEGETCTKVDTELSVAGAFPDIGEYLSGTPENMVAFVNQPAPRIVTVAFSFSANADIQAPQFSRRGAVTLAVVETLVQAGYGVRLMAVSNKRGKNGATISTSTIIKESTALLDTDALAFWACHRLVQRRICFAMQEREPKEIRNIFGFQYQGGYGGTVKFEPSEAGIDCDILIDPSMHGDCGSDKNATSYFHKLMADFK
tara:strand:+ start:1314 stop:2147 length:834 start_codon:yes stop_codon:yes gene_type:complete